MKKGEPNHMSPTRDNLGKKRCILLATDFSISAQQALAHAIRFATVLKARLVILTVVKAVPWGRQKSSLHGRHTTAMLELGRLARIAAETSLTVRPTLVFGVPSDSIVEIAREVKARLVVMGNHGRTGWDRVKLGSTAEAVVRAAPCPVLTVRGIKTSRVPINVDRILLSRVLVPIDFSACADRALAYAGKLAEQFGAHIRLLHVEEPLPIDPGMTSTVSSSEEKARQVELRRRLRRRMLTLHRHDIQADFVIKVGSPGKVILKQTQECSFDMIVMGTNGRQRLAHLVFGSVAAYVVRCAICPVLTIKIS